MKQKKLIGILTEVLFLVSVFAYLLFIKNAYSVSASYDLWAFLAYACIILGILVLSGPFPNRILALLLGGVFTLYLVAQNVYHKGFDQYFRFATALGLRKEVADVKGAAWELVKFSDIVPFLVLLLIVILFLVLYFVLQKGKVRFRFSRLFCIPLFLLAFFSFHAMEAQIEKTKEGYTDFDIYKSDYYLYDAVPTTNQFVQKLGLLTLSYRDAQSLRTTESSDAAAEREEIAAYLASADTAKYTNEKTGLFAGKDLLIVQAESLMNMAISEELTPNMYWYMQNGIVFKNFNTPLLIGSTSDSEFMTNTSMIPVSGGYPVCYQHITNAFPLTLGEVFQNAGYTTEAFHNNYSEYYNRAETFPKYGYHFMDSYALGVKNLTPDSELAEQLGWILSEKEHFLGYWVTYSGHQTYTKNEVGVDPADYQKVLDTYPGIDEANASYIAKAMDLDKALGTFINVMDWSGRLENTVILVFGDHHAKGLDLGPGSNYDQVFGRNEETDPEIGYTTCFLFAPGMTHEESEAYATALDFLPTICNLWDIHYPREYAFGRDIFSGGTLTFNADYSLECEDFYYDALKDILHMRQGTEEAARQKIDAFMQKRNICGKILQLDYFGEE
ncbi:MAG: LTA synthase family protein [Erysipelotrichaceae bacterium]|nr:LTA synthase family protein [Erysipelotrichaceae bacterium]